MKWEGDWLGGVGFAVEFLWTTGDCEFVGGYGFGDDAASSDLRVIFDCDWCDETTV